MAARATSSTTTNRIAYRIQHLAGRDEALNRLLSLLRPAPSDLEIITDSGNPPRSPWRCYRRCLEELPDPFTHVVVLQDDATVCQNFVEAASRVSELRPDDIVLFFVGGFHNRTSKNFNIALQRGEPFCDVYFRDIHHVVGVLWPREMSKAFLEWVDAKRIPGLRLPYQSDDAVLGAFARLTKKQIIATVPCLVEHPDDVPSTIGRAAHAGKDKGRVAIYFTGDDPLRTTPWAGS